MQAFAVATVALAALGATAFLWSLWRLVATRNRLLAYLGDAAPEMRVAEITPVGFHADVLGTSVSVDLATLSRLRRRALSERAWFDEIVGGMRARIPVPAAAPFALVEDRILPLLKPAHYVAIFARYPPAARLAHRSFAPGLMVTYVVAGPDRRVAVTTGSLDAWAMGAGALHDRAIANFRKQTAHMLAEIGGPRLRYEDIDGYDATRILIADLITPPGVPEPVIAIPEETVLLIAPGTDRESLADDAARRHTRSARPLSPLLFRPSEEGMTPLL